MRRGLFRCALTGAALLLTAACDDGISTEAKLSVEAPLVPIKLSISTSGKISLSYSGNLFNFLGFKVSASAGATIGEGFVKPKQAQLLVVRTVADGSYVDHAYEVKTDRKISVYMNGEFRQEITPGRILIEAPMGKESVIAVVDGESKEGADLSKPPSYQVLYQNKQLDLPDPFGASQGQGIDFDAGQADSTGAMDLDEADIYRTYGDGMRGWGRTKFGTTDNPSPTPEQCDSDAQTRAAGRISDEEVTAGQMFCVVTSKSNVAWLKVVRVTHRKGWTDRPSLSFLATAWMRR